MRTAGLSVTHVLMTLRRDDAEIVAPGLCGEWLALVRSEAVRMLAEYDAMGGHRAYMELGADDVERAAGMRRMADRIAMLEEDLRTVEELEGR